MASSHAAPEWALATHSRVSLRLGGQGPVLVLGFSVYLLTTPTMCSPNFCYYKR